MKNKYNPTRVFEQKIPIHLKSRRVNICIYTHSSFASRMRTRAYITYVCACARARMTERVSALKGQKIAGNISQNRAKKCRKKFFKLVENPYVSMVYSFLRSRFLYLSSIVKKGKKSPLKKC